MQHYYDAKIDLQIVLRLTLIYWFVSIQYYGLEYYAPYISPVHACFVEGTKYVPRKTVSSVLKSEDIYRLSDKQRFREFDISFTENIHPF